MDKIKQFRDFVYKYKTYAIALLIGFLFLLGIIVSEYGTHLDNHIDKNKSFTPSLQLNFNVPSFVKLHQEKLAKSDIYEPETDTHFVVNRQATKIASQTSFARQVRRINVMDRNGFAFYKDAERNHHYIYREDQPYTGWYGTEYNGWYYVKSGKVQADKHLSQNEVVHLVTIKDLFNVLGIHQKKASPLMVGDYTKQSVAVVKRLQYSIMTKGEPGLILSNLPDGDFHLVANTADYVDFPMEVVAEARIGGKDWLHVYNAYDELGWILKDPTYTSYVLTNYSERELYDTVKYIFKEELDIIPGKIGASFVNHETLAQVDMHNEIFVPASTLKIYVLAELYHQYQEGKLDPEEWVSLTWDNMVGGAGVITAYGEGASFTLESLVGYVVDISDNSAANTLIDAVGGGANITPYVHSYGLLETYVDGKYYANDNVKFYTSPHDAARLFALLGRRELNGEPWDSLLINQLRRNTATTMRYALPWVDSYNKSGTADPERNDVANFMTEYGDFAIAIYSSTWYNVDNRQYDMGRIVTRVYYAFIDIRQKLFHPYDPSLGFYDGQVNMGYY